MATRYTLEDMALLFAGRDRDGTSITGRSRLTGIDRKTLRRREHLVAQSRKERQPTFAEVVIAPAAHGPRDAGLRVQIGIATIDIANSGVDRSLLEMVVSVLAAQC
jgi:hypothetical protein